MISRRRFLALGPVIAATAGAGPSSLVSGVLSDGPGATPRPLSRSRFAPHVHTRFRVQLEPLRHTEVELIEVNDLPTAGGAAAAAASPEGQFSLLFRGQSVPAFGQGTYHVEHSRMGALVLFLVPVGGPSQGPVYQAVFNSVGAPPPETV